MKTLLLLLLRCRRRQTKKVQLIRYKDRCPQRTSHSQTNAFPISTAHKTGVTRHWEDGWTIFVVNRAKQFKGRARRISEEVVSLKAKKKIRVKRVGGTEEQSKAVTVNKQLDEERQR